MPAPNRPGFTRTSACGIKTISPMAAKLLIAALTTGPGSPLAPYTGVAPDSKEDNCCDVTLYWYTAQVSLRQMARAVQALKPSGVGPVTISMNTLGTVTSAAV